MIRKLVGVFFLSLVLCWGFVSTALAETIYYATQSGDIGEYDDVLDTSSLVGNLGGFSIGQVIGIAYDANANRILILDRNAPAVYSMDPASGTASLLFVPNESFQGGAVKGNTLYGINENNQTLVAYDLTTFNPIALTGTSLPGHNHALGVDPVSGQLISANGGNGVFAINDDGSVGADLTSGAAFYEDIDFYGSDYIGVRNGTELYVVDSTTGAESILVTALQTGLSNIIGVAVALGAGGGGNPAPPAPATPVPTMSVWGLGILIALMGIVGFNRRRKM